MHRILFIVFILIIMASCQSVQNGKQVRNYDHWLEGTWTAPAFQGNIAETWTFDHNGFLNLEGLYQQNGDTVYWERIKIDTVGDDVLYIAKPHDASGFIYQLVSKNDTSLVFENKIYSNPYKITYRKIDDDHFDRVNTVFEEGNEVNNYYKYTRLGKLPLVEDKWAEPSVNIQQKPLQDKEVHKLTKGGN